MQQKYPLISCICVTNNRVELLKKAVNCFAVQNYPNKELVISYPENDLKTKAFIDALISSAIIKTIRIERTDGESVGNARNFAVARCEGDYICVWDDDDWYHSSRLSYQFNSMALKGFGYSASVLTRLILFDATFGKAYLSFPHCWENTLLCRKEVLFQNQYSDANQGEDSHIIKFLDGKKFLYHIEEAPFLYVYIYHGKNTWNYEHYLYLINKSELLDEQLSKEIQKII